MIMSQAEYTMDVYVTDGATGTEISNIIVNKAKDNAGQTATGKVDMEIQILMISTSPTPMYRKQVQAKIRKIQIRHIRIMDL